MSLVKKFEVFVLTTLGTFSDQQFPCSSQLCDLKQPGSLKKNGKDSGLPIQGGFN